MENIYTNDDLTISLSNNKNLIIDKTLILKRRTKEQWQELDALLADKIKTAMRKGANKIQINGIKMHHYVTTKCGNENGPDSYTRHIRTIITSDGKIYVIINRKKFIKVTHNSKEQIKLSVMRTILQCANKIGTDGSLIGYIATLDTPAIQLCRRLLASAPKILLGNIYPDWVFKDINKTGFLLSYIGFANIKNIKYAANADIINFIIKADIKTPEAIKLMSSCEFWFNTRHALKYYNYLKKAYKNSNVNVEMIMANRMTKINNGYINDVFYLFHEYNGIKRIYKEQLVEFNLPNKFHKKDLKDAHDILAKLHRDIHNKLNYVEFNIPNAEKYNVTVDDYHFDVAKSSTELSNLSDICHNCVAGYTRSVLYGRSIILYGISETSYPICIELDPTSNTIEQCYAPHNKQVDPENLLKCLEYFRHIGVDHNGWCSKKYVLQSDIFDNESGELLFAAGTALDLALDLDPINDDEAVLMYITSNAVDDDDYDDLDDDYIEDDDDDILAGYVENDYLDEEEEYYEI